MNSKGKLRISEVNGVGGPGAVAEIELRLDLNMGRKSLKLQRKMLDFGGHWVRGMDVYVYMDVRNS